jgi:DMSO/TMAO reductase YedYZ molybdopterin-dependent catalytic subunit
MPTLDGYEISDIPKEKDTERQCVISRHEGSQLRPPPAPDELHDDITSDDKLFQTIHMGAVDVDQDRWLLVIDGLVERPFALTFDQLLRLPHEKVTAVHECFGSPLKPATENLWRIGNVEWEGVRLATILNVARPLSNARYVWSEGLDSGTFAGVTTDRYQKDLPLEKAASSEVLVASSLNGHPLSRERGAPVRLVVPGYFGTNSTKWLCRLSLQAERAFGPYTTRFYNTPDMENESDTLVPVWKIDVNSMITTPTPGEVLNDPRINIEGWAWSHDEVVTVQCSIHSEKTSWAARVEPKQGCGWQKFRLSIEVVPGEYWIVARATAKNGQRQELKGRRNHVHEVYFTVI